MPEVEVWTTVDVDLDDFSDEDLLTTVDVDLDDFSDEDLLDEIERRGLGAEVPETTSSELIQSIYQKRRLGNDYQQELEQLIYQTIGKII